MSEAMDAAVTEYRKVKQDAALEAAATGPEQQPSQPAEPLDDQDQLNAHYQRVTGTEPPAHSQAMLEGSVDRVALAYLGEAIQRVESLLGLVMQMQAASSPAAAQLLIEYVSADQGPASAAFQAGEGVDPAQLLHEALGGAVSPAQQRSQDIAAANGWLISNATWESWYAQARDEPGVG